MGEIPKVCRAALFSPSAGFSSADFLRQQFPLCQACWPHLGWVFACHGCMMKVLERAAAASCLFMAAAGCMGAWGCMDFGPGEWFLASLHLLIIFAPFCILFA